MNYSNPRHKKIRHSFSQPVDPLAPTQAVNVGTPVHKRYNSPPPRWMRPRRRFLGCSPLSCFLFLIGAVGILFVLAVYLLFPARTKIIILGIDYTQPWNFVGRSDTMILASVNPLKPQIALLSIPRDLWVSIPGYGENRINTAHFFAESEQAGAGPVKAIETIRANFGVEVDYYLRIRFEGFKDVINAMGGVDIELAEPMAGYPAGRHHLTGNKALAFARSRIGSDDFFRMEQGQMLLKAALRQLLFPWSWPRLPGVMAATLRSIDTNVPSSMWPRLGFALLRVGPDGIDSRIIQREMVTPFTTDQGANVLLPDWSQITPLVAELFE